MPAAAALKFDISVITYTGPNADDPSFTDVQIEAGGAVQPGSAGTGSKADELHFPYGVWGVPPDPVRDAQGRLDKSQSCQVLYAFEGDYLHVWPLEDPRRVKEFPNWKKGEAGQYGPAQNVTRLAADGSISQATTTDGTSAGDAVFARTAPNGFTWQGPWGRMTFDPTGFHVLCASGARFDLGEVHGLPAPLDALSTYATIQAQMVALESSVTSLGPDTGNSQSAALAPPLTIYLAALAKAVSDLAIATKALASTPAATGVAPYATVALAALIDQALSEAEGITTVPPFAASTSLT
jgi:hypothetical protein